MSTEFELPLDSTGLASGNLIENEEHLIGDNNIRVISPIKGVFFSESIVVRDLENDIVLEKGQDYILSEHYHSLSMFHGKDIAGIIIITNYTVSDRVSITYQALGELYNKTDEAIKNFIEAKGLNHESGNILWSVFNEQSSFTPSRDHIDIGDQIGFEYVTYGLEKIRNAIMLSDFNLLDTVMAKLENYLQAFMDHLEHKTDTEYVPLAEEFILEFNKLKLKLDKVANFPVADLNTVKAVSIEEHEPDYSDYRYVSLRGITAFKEEIYNRLVSKKRTNIGVHYGTLSLPLLESIESLTNGATIVIDAYENFNIGTSSPFDSAVYPDINSHSDRWSITKVINNVDNKGGVLLGINLNTSETYIGILRTQSESVRSNIVWRKQVSEYDIENVIEMLSKHIDDKNNPHKTRKDQVDLGNVENLPVVDREDITCRMPSRKYVTFDALLLFMKAYMNCIKTSEDMEGEDCDTSDVIRNIKLIFAPCGPCGPCCTPNKVMENTEEPTNLPTVDPYETLYGWFCEGTTKMGIYADGVGGTYTELIEENSEDCGEEG